VHRVGGGRVEHMVWVTKDGPEILDMMPADEIWPPYFAFD
jgi:Xaa-Pro aminopeptidase